jgi:hypothetical protein
VRRFDAPEALDIRFYEVRARSMLNRVPERSPMPFRWTVNPYRGCTHACVYCFARPTHRYLDFDAGRDFEREIVVKVNAPEVLRGELARASWTREHVALGNQHRPLPVGRGSLPADAGDLAGAARAADAVLGADQVAAAAARPAAAGGARGRGAVQRSAVGADARRAGLAGDRAAHAAPGGAAGRRGAADARRHTDQRAGRAADARDQRRSSPGARDRRTGPRGGGSQRDARRAPPAPGVREVFMDWLEGSRAELVDDYAALYARGSYLPAAERARLHTLVRPEHRERGGGGRFERPRTQATREDRVGQNSHRQPSLF